MIDLSIGWRYSLLFLTFGLSLSAYGKENAEDIFEKPQEEKVEATSTFFITPKDVKQNYRRYHRIDRSVTKMDRFTAAEQHYYNFQDLGNHWTAAQHIFYRLPQHIGATYGLSAYDFYFQPPQDIHYYSTQKAYAHFNIVLANLGSFLFNGCYTQRLLETWHIGTNWYGAMTENEWPHSKDDKIVNAFPHFDIFTHIKSPDESYHLFTSWSNRHYLTRETGGIRSNQKTYKKTDQFEFKEPNPSRRYKSSLRLLAEPYMYNKIDKEKKVMHKDHRQHFYLYHHYEFNKPLQLYHELHYSRKKNLFTIDKLDASFLPFISKNDCKKSECLEHNSVVMQSLGNEIGVKGDIAQPHLFYAVYYRLEAIDLNYDFSKPEGIQYHRPLKGQKEEKEHYLGGHTRWHYAQHRKLHLDGAYLLQKGGYHTLNIAYQDKFFKLAYHTIKHKTPYILAYGYTRHRLWDKAFVAPSAQAIDAAVWYNAPHIAMHPILSFKKLNNHIYYRKAVLNDPDDHCMAEPMQATTPIYLLSLEGKVNLCFFSYFHFDHNLTILLKEISKGGKIFKGYVPPYMYTGRYYYAHQPYHKKMDIETGLNIHFKELYYGDGYDVVAQQFYRQNKFPVQGRPIVDIFCNIRINNLKLSLKYSYINEYFNKPTAYFATPFYPGLKKAADIGIHWSFFD